MQIDVPTNRHAVSNNEVEEFLGVSLPCSMIDSYKSKPIFKKLNQQQMMEIIDFKPPFLRTEKLLVFEGENNSVLQSTSLGIGIITPKDTAGHYNQSIFLAMCGWLMASTASVHLVALFPNKAPQVIEADGVKPLLSSDNDGLWKPAANGTPICSN